MAEDFSDRTQTFSIETPQKLDMQQVLVQVYDALKEKGYNPISQIVGYILSEDPTYITTHNNARSLIRKIDRDELLKAMAVSYTHLILRVLTHLFNRLGIERRETFTVSAVDDLIYRNVAVRDAVLKLQAARGDDVVHAINHAARCV